MAHFEDPYNLLRYVKKTFMEHDETGVCGEFIRDRLPEKKTLFPEIPNSCESKEEEQSSSSEDYSDWDFEKADFRRTKFYRRVRDRRDRTEAVAGKSREGEAVAPAIGGRDGEITFETEEINKNRKVGQSLLSHQLEQRSPSAANPFLEYAKYEGIHQFRADTRTFRIFLTMLARSERDYSVGVCVQASAKVSDLIGLTCFKYTADNPNESVRLKENLREYALYIADERGEVDWEFPSLDPNVKIEKFFLEHLALVDLSEVEFPKEAVKGRYFAYPKNRYIEDKSRKRVKEQTMERFMEDLRTMASLVHETFRVDLLYKKRKKVRVSLAISLDKVGIEVDPDPEPGGKAVPKVPDISREFDAREIVACEVLKMKPHNRTVFRIVNHAEDVLGRDCYKNNDFESDAVTADKIMDKLKNVLNVRGSSLRKDYLESRPKEKEREEKKETGFRHVFSLLPR